MATIRKKRDKWCVEIRLLLEEMEADNKRLEEQRKKIFEKKQNDENIGGLAYLLKI